jgi:NAD(P)-dependent dehydrogenase (short-subunit alcohol dehydrogenase family)
MQESVCLITGATSGIGRATAHEMARLGWTVVVVGRDSEKCEKTVRSIMRNTGNPHVDYLVADLSYQKDIHILAGQVRERHPRLDVLINNAGAIAWTRQLSLDGIELTIALNHLGYFLLTNLLLDVLQASAPSRIINVSSSAHMGAEIDLEDIQKSKRYRWREAYGQSKLANLMFTYELARRLQGTGVDVNALHPGLVATNLPANGKLPLGWLSGPFLRLLLAVKGRSATEGARTVVYLATAKNISGVSGKYFVDERESSSSAASHDVGVARKLWAMSSNLTGLPS